MIEPIFEGARARCMRHHDTLLGPKEHECNKCKLLNRNLSLKPPFQVRSDRTVYEVKMNEVYTVHWVIRDGAKEYEEHMIGYVFKTAEGKPSDRVYDATDFTPLAFLTEDETEKLKSEPEKDDDLVPEQEWWG